MKTKNVLAFIVIFVVVLGAAYYLLRGNSNEQADLVGGDKDEHGCISSAGYSWCESGQKCLRPWEEGCQDYIVQIFEAIKAVTSVDFSEPSGTELTWQVENEEGLEDLTLQASMISADTVIDEDFQKIKSFIKQDGFEEDMYNGRGSFFGEFGAYRKDNFSLVCTLSGIYSDFNPDDPRYEPQTTDKDVKIICAILDKSLLPEISVEKRIKEALAAKHNVKVSQIQITITQEAESYVRGNVEFLPGGSENSGMFLATKVNDSWQIVFDGNGSIACEDLEDYNFPGNMIEGVCYR